jgi:hypothetical protein
MPSIKNNDLIVFQKNFSHAGKGGRQLSAIKAFIMDFRLNMNFSAGIPIFKPQSDLLIIRPLHLTALNSSSLFQRAIYPS